MTVEKLGKYQLLRKIGRGGMAELFLARLSGVEGFEKLIAVKRILPELSQSSQASDVVALFLDEARLAALLNHPNIVQIYELGKADDQYFIAMEYVHGVDLRRMLRRAAELCRPIPIPIAVRVTSFVCEALVCAHGQVDDHGRSLGIVHRDISPHNVLVSLDGNIKLTDFGIAKASSRMVETKAGTIRGKVNYMSPEQVLAQRLDGRSDLFSVGILLYELCTGQRPFEHADEFEIMRAVTGEHPPPPSTLRQDVLHDLETIINHALAKDAADRFQNAQSMQSALDAFLMHQRLVCNTSSIRAYIRELFPETIEALAAVEKTVSASQDRALSAASILLCSPSVPSTQRMRPPQGARQPEEQTLSHPVQATSPPAAPQQRDHSATMASQKTVAPAVTAATQHDSGTSLVRRSIWRRSWLRRAGIIVAASLLSTIVGVGVGVYGVQLRSLANSADAGGHNAAPGQSVNGSQDKMSATSSMTPAAGDPRQRRDAATAIDRKSPQRTARPSRARSKRRTGRLSVNSVPWSEVWVAGKRLGITPLAGKSLPARRYRVTLRNRDEGLERQVWVTIRPGQTTRIMVNLAD